MSSLATLFDVVRKDGRFQYEAYTFVFEALSHTQKCLGRGIAEGDTTPENSQRHVTGEELVRGMCELARDEFGMLAPVVFRLWGVTKTGDIGEIVFRLIEAKLLSKTESDSREDFQDLFDLDEALREGFSITLGELTWPNRGVA